MHWQLVATDEASRRLVVAPISRLLDHEQQLRRRPPSSPGRIVLLVNGKHQEMARTFHCSCYPLVWLLAVAAGVVLPGKVLVLTRGPPVHGRLRALIAPFSRVILTIVVFFCFRFDLLPVDGVSPPLAPGTRRSSCVGPSPGLLHRSSRRLFLPPSHLVAEPHCIAERVLEWIGALLIQLRPLGCGCPVRLPIRRGWCLWSCSAPVTWQSNSPGSFLSLLGLSQHPGQAVAPLEELRGLAAPNRRRHSRPVSPSHDAVHGGCLEPGVPHATSGKARQTVRIHQRSRGHDLG